jgi:hypothetical protein
MKSAWAGLAILLLMQAGSIYGQQQDDSTSVADAARRTREQKKEQPKAAKIWDNDTIPRKPGEVSVIGQTPGAGAAGDDSAAAKDATGNAAAATADSAASAPNPSSEPTPAAATGDKSDREKLASEVGAIQSDLTAAKSQLQTLKADLDIAQRKFNLDSQTYYSKPNYVADKDGAASIAAEKADLESKQVAVADAQMKVDRLEAKLAAIR